MLRDLTLDDVVEVTGGALVDGPAVPPGESGEEVVTSVSTDTRTIQPGALFVALRGEKHDAHEYLVQAREKGAAALVVDRALTLDEAKLPHVVVPDTTHALGDIARYVRDAFAGPVVGITGSVGKTTTKEMVAAVLEAAFTVRKNDANFNNEIGAPQTVFAMEPADTVLVQEMGMRGLGQIRRLCEIVAPTIGVITGIGSSHIELLGSRENIAKAKGELFEMLPEDGTAILPVGDDFHDYLRSRFEGETITVGMDGQGDVQAQDIARHENGWRFTAVTPWGVTKCFVASPGRFNVQNALLALAVGGKLGIAPDAMAKALLRWQPPKMRLEAVRTARGVQVISDAYNAAPESMVEALKTLRDTPVGGDGNKRIAVLGEMRELGSYTDEGHTLVGRAAATLAQPDMLVLVGEKTRRIAAGAIMEKFPQDRIHQFAETDEAARVLPLIVRPGDVVLVKGSRAMAMERIVEALEKSTAPALTPPAPLPQTSGPRAGGGGGSDAGVASASSSPSPTPLSGGEVWERGPGGEGGPTPPRTRVQMLELDDIPASAEGGDGGAGGNGGNG